jgi:hypothetical protein
MMSSGNVGAPVSMRAEGKKRTPPTHTDTHKIHTTYNNGNQDARTEMGGQAGSWQQDAVTQAPHREEQVFPEVSQGGAGHRGMDSAASTIPGLPRSRGFKAYPLGRALRKTVVVWLRKPLGEERARLGLQLRQARR